MIIAGEEAGLKFSYPIPALGAAESRIAGKPMLNPYFLEVVVVEATELAGQPAQRPDKR